MSTQWNQHGVFATPPGASGLPAMPQGQQTLPPQQYGGYSIDHLPPPPGGVPSPYGAQPGVPGATIAQPLTTMQPGQQWGPPQAPAPQGWPQAPQTPQGYAPQPAPAGSRPGTVALDDNTVLDGPAVPQELRGRTWGEARRLYSALSTDWLQRNSRPTTPAGQSLAAQGYGAQPQGQPQAPQQPPASNGQPPARDPRQFWQNPDQHIASAVQEAINSQVLPALQPVLRRTQQGAILEARQIAATGTPDFQQLEPAIMEIVSRARPEDLTDPQVWSTAADMARGRAARAGTYRPPAPAPAPGGGYGPGASVPAYAAPAAPPVHSFFAEGPSAPQIPGSYGAPGGSTATQEDYFHANKFQMPIQDYMAWKHGAQPAGAGGYR